MTTNVNDGIWSETKNGLAARMLVEFEDLNPGLHFVIFLELKNNSREVISVTNRPEISAEVFDLALKPVSASAFLMDGPSTNAFIAVIPPSAYLGFRIDTQTVALPTQEHAKALVALGDNAWNLIAGQYLIKAKLFVNNENGPAPKLWQGEIDLPPVKLTLTTTMLEKKFP